MEIHSYPHRQSIRDSFYITQPRIQALLILTRGIFDQIITNLVEHSFTG